MPRGNSVRSGVLVLLSCALCACDGMGQDGPAPTPTGVKIVDRSDDASAASLQNKFTGRFAEGLSVPSTAEPRDPTEDDVPPLDPSGEPVDL